MRSIMCLLRDCVPLSRAAEQAVAATEADWRYESRTATSTAHRLWVNVRSTVAVGRAFLGGEFRGAPSTSAPFFARLSVLVGILTLTLLFVSRPFLQSDAPMHVRFWYQLSMGAPFVVLAIPVLAFLVEISGCRSRSGPSLGALAGLVGVILVGAVLIAEGQIYSTWAEWQYFGRSSPYSYRGTTSLLNPELNRLAASPEYWSSLIQNAVVGGVFAFSLVILARRIRESGSAHGWVLGLSPVMFLAGSFCLDLVGYAPWIGAAYRAVGSFGMFAGFVTWTLLTAAAVRRQSAPQFTAAGAQPGTE